MRKFFLLYTDFIQTFYSRNFEVWPMFLFLNVISALEGTP